MIDGTLLEKYNGKALSFKTYKEYDAVTGYDWVKSILVFVFPYPNQKANADSNFYLTAKFAYGKDYHVYVKNELEQIAKQLGLKRYEVMVDVSCLKEKVLAHLAGLGTIGRNNLLITEKYGTNVVIGEILTDEECSEYGSIREDLCLHCDKCLKACPTKALESGFDRKKCLSYLSQKISDSYDLYEKMTLAYGCDICQDVCPQNQKRYSNHFNFDFEEKSKLSLSNLRELNPETYKEYYQNKTFHWIGYLKMLRNLLVMETNKKRITEKELSEFQEAYQQVPWFKNHLEYLKGKISHES